MAKPKIDAKVMRALRALGSIGGKKRAKNLTAERRSEIAKKAAATRWKKTE